MPRTPGAVASGVARGVDGSTSAQEAGWFGSSPGQEGRDNEAGGTRDEGLGTLSKRGVGSIRRTDRDCERPMFAQCVEGQGGLYPAEGAVEICHFATGPPASLPCWPHYSCAQTRRGKIRENDAQSQGSGFLDPGDGSLLMGSAGGVTGGRTAPIVEAGSIKPDSPKGESDCCNGSKGGRANRWSSWPARAWEISAKDGGGSLFPRESREVRWVSIVARREPRPARARTTLYARAECCPARVCAA